MSHFRHSCPEQYRFSCSLKNLNILSPIYSQNNYWGSVEGSSLGFWFLLPTIMMCNQLVSETRLSHGVGAGSGVPPWCPGPALGSLLPEFLSYCPISSWGNAGPQVVCGVPMASAFAPVRQEAQLSLAAAGAAIALLGCGPGSRTPQPRPPKDRDLQAASAGGSEAQTS